MESERPNREPARNPVREPKRAVALVVMVTTMHALTPFTPTSEDPWDAAKAAHLLRRAGFGAGPAEIAACVARGPAASLARLFDFETGAADFEAQLARHRAEFEDTKGVGAQVQGLRREWIYRMVHSPHPLAEKLTLFWHDHFACQESKVIRTYLLLEQNQLFRRHAAGSFPELLRGVARDPAMLVFLDNRLSVMGSPNENWARELLELFTVGVDRYTQRDITELARVFTGWTTPELHVGEFLFDPKTHDVGDKVVFGRVIRGRSGDAGLEEGGQALDIICARDDTYHFLATKLIAWFVTDAAAPAAAEELAEVLRDSGGSIREALRVLLSSRWFHAEEHRFALYKNPVELIVSSARLLGMNNPHLAGLETHGLRMGMQLFEPPSVAGWDHGEAWVHSGSVAPRFNFALAMSQLAHAGRKVAGRASLDLDALRGGDEAAADHRTILRALAERLLQRPLSVEQEDPVVELLSAGGELPEGDREARDAVRSRVRAAIHMTLSAPQFAQA